MSDQERLLDSAKRLLEGGKDARDDQALEAAHPSDIAATLQRLPLDQQVALFRRLSPERAGEVLPGLDDTTLLALVRASTRRRSRASLTRCRPSMRPMSWRSCIG